MQKIWVLECNGETMGLFTTVELAEKSIQLTHHKVEMEYFELPGKTETLTMWEVRTNQGHDTWSAECRPVYDRVEHL